ncbi:MAG TPA: isochorismatase family protein [Candidatus Janibacter merdipullorum]|nr:isochorismatase family protein [Candidatus Janibacter merdipullorum]
MTADPGAEVLARYGEGGLAGTLAPGTRAALLVVDLQRGFTDPACGPGFEMPRVVSETEQLVAAAHEHGVSVFFTTIAFERSHDPVWLEKMPAMLELREGTRWVEIDPATGMDPGDHVIVKQAPSAFSGTDLEERLAALDVDTLVVVGATTSGCVRASVVDAVSIGLRPFVVGTAVGDRERHPHDAALVDIQAKYGEVVALPTALALLAAPVGGAP